MAEEIIVGVVIGVLEKTIAMAAERSGLMPGFKGELKKMEGLVTDINDLLADAEGKKVQNPIVLRWLKDFKAAILEAEIVLDELHYEGLRRKVHEANRGQREFKRGAAAKVCSFFSMFKHDVSFRVRMNPKVRGINEELKAIKQEAQGLALEILQNPDLLLGRDSDAMVLAANRQTDSLPEQFVAGRSKEESAIVDMLLSVSSSDNNPSVSVLPIVGMGGLGKTTLAKSIYNNGKIVNHFSKRCWVCVSDKFEVTTIFKGILESLRGGGKVEISSRDDIVRGIEKEVSGERFLFVLDDVWNQESILWDSFSTSLVGLNSANGSCCLLTTRLHKTADLVHTSSFHPFKLDKLSDDSCWSIIGKKATKGGEMPVEFDIHKKEILRKCKGLPLAANAFGCLLGSQRREDWVSVVEALKVQVAVDGDKDISPILKLSYDYLPHPRIKKCFAYCSVFCKDEKMCGRDLIELWMAEGYLRDDVQGKTMEEDGVGCLRLLLQSSLLEKDNAYSNDLYEMHDLVHDLACSISNQEYHDGDICRNVSVNHRWNYRWNDKSGLIQVLEGDVSDEMLSKYRHARVMILSGGEINRLPNAIGNLKHIRCLTLSLVGVKSLPESLCKLYNLQTLRLRFFDRLQCLPQGLSNLISLRHLCCGETSSSAYLSFAKLEMPPYMRRLTHLQTLEFFNVGEKNGCEIRELGPMKNLKGSLSIRNLELVKGKEEATSANLIGKKNMIDLELTWGSIEGHRRKCDKLEDEQVLEGLEPCSALQRLRINHFMGVRFPKWLGKLSALEVLELTDCENITELGYSGDAGFPKLKTLVIYGCLQLSSAPTSFPVLQKLDVKRIQASAVSDIISTTTNSLEDLRLWEVSGMRRLSDIVIESPLLSCLKNLDIEGCDDLTEIPSSMLECCKYLESLTVYTCTELVSFPLNLQQTPSLSTIGFWGCPKLFTTDASLPRGFEYLTNLQELRIRVSQHSIDWDGLKTGCSTTLRDLGMEGSPRTQLPQQLEDFSSLVMLWISGFDSIERLPGWLAKLTSLRLLGLISCPKLEHLPTDALTNLQNMYIHGCPLLRENQGDEIDALPNLKVNWE